MHASIARSRTVNGRDSFLALNSIRLRYGAVTVLENVSFSVEKGEFLTLLGPSGSGKTSLLRMIAGFVAPTAGAIQLAGRQLNRVPPHLRDIGMVFQSYALFPHKTVEQNIAFGLRMRRMERAEIGHRVSEALQLVHLSGYGARYPNELSGGEQQRVAIARAICMNPSILLLDEPMSNLDALLRASMRTEIVEIVRKIGITTIAVTHNQDEALSMSDRVAVISHGQIQQVDSPLEIYTRPVSAFVASFVGQSNLIPCRVTDIEGQFAKVTSDIGELVIERDGEMPGPEFTVVVRPEAIELCEHGRSGDNIFQGTVRRTMFYGSARVYDVEIERRILVVQEAVKPGKVAFAPGDPVTVYLNPAAMKPIRQH